MNNKPPIVVFSDLLGKVGLNMYTYTIDNSTISDSLKLEKFHVEVKKLGFTVRESGIIEHWNGWFKKNMRSRFDDKGNVFVRGDMEYAKPLLQLYCDMHKQNIRVYHMSESPY